MTISGCVLSSSGVASRAHAHIAPIHSLHHNKLPIRSRMESATTSKGPFAGRAKLNGWKSLHLFKRGILEEHLPTRVNLESNLILKHSYALSLKQDCHLLLESNLILKHSYAAKEIPQSYSLSPSLFLKNKPFPLKR